MTNYVFPYKSASEGAIALADALGYKLIGRDVGLNSLDEDRMIINWGCGTPHSFFNEGDVLNHPHNCYLAINKIKTFKKLNARQVPTITWTEYKAVAEGWCQAGHKICVRKIVEGMDGAGLTIVEEGRELPTAPLYTILINSTAEYRITVCNGKAIGFQKKVPQRPDSDPRIRTTSGGWGFSYHERSEMADPAALERYATTALDALGLDFGGVDILCAETGSRGYTHRTYHVLEVNTAPHLTPIMVRKMAVAIKEMVD